MPIKNTIESLKKALNCQAKNSNSNNNNILVVTQCSNVELFSLADCCSVGKNTLNGRMRSKFEYQILFEKQ